MSTIFKIISLFTPAERRRLIPLTGAVLMTSLLEVAGIGSLGPFMAVVADPTVIQRQPLLAALYQAGGFGTPRAFMIALGLGVVLMVLITTASKMLTLYAIYRFVGNRRYRLGHRLFRQYIYQPYSYYLDHNSSELSKNLLTEVDQVVNGVLRPSMEAFARGSVAIAIVLFLLVANPLVALAAAVVFGGLYSCVYAFVRPRLSRYGRKVREANRLRFKAAGEAFGAIKDVKILGKEESFSRLYAIGARRYATTQAAQQILSMIPAQAMHSMAVGFAVGMIVIMLSLQGSLVEVLPLLAMFAFAVQRLMPNLESVFRSMALIRYNAHTVDALHKDMTEAPPPPPLSDGDSAVDRPPVYPFKQTVSVRELSFSYPASREPVLREVDLTIVKNTTVGLVGVTGCGKTTLVDVIMGLLQPTAGSVLVDGAVPPLRPWQRNFGYVPQQIYLSDDSVAANIAFGIPEHLRDVAAVERAARVASIHEFVTSELPDGYNTLVGERGIRLSGGQRQRVGIARALYHDPDILVMDEATSALDSVTEEAVMDAIQTLMHTKTIILIAHRITTVQECDRIYLMEQGRIVAQGSYDEMVRENARFRAMARVK